MGHGLLRCLLLAFFCEVGDVALRVEVSGLDLLLTLTEDVCIRHAFKATTTRHRGPQSHTFMSGLVSVLFIDFGTRRLQTLLENIVAWGTAISQSRIVAPSFV
ncbi:hypothetical protein LY76DRAFT_269738 [Colletotrichum caudatum]|nr:hypothetical protein LY76DRAFT_269738 [Colletotrichum caudatum]